MLVHDWIAFRIFNDIVTLTMDIVTDQGIGMEE